MKRVFFALLCLTLAGFMAADDLSNRLRALLPERTVSELVEKGKAQKNSYREKGVVPTLAPSIPLSRDALSFWSGKDPSFFVESLFLYRKKAGAETAPGDDVPRVSAILRSLSTLEGIEYYSTSRKRMRTLYEKSYTIDDPKTRKRLPDRTEGSAAGVSVYALQKDLTFGEYVYRYSYLQNQDSVAFLSENLETLSYKVIKGINPERLRVSLIVLDMGDCLLVYGLTRADIPAIPAIDERLNASFTTRAEAIYQWFIGEYEKRR